ncbi:hypothetical protein B0H13DRAFT_2362809 [Mycena leptocephala]|nr:hypothetical protein B0H13DRAFT_2362809 [Mycena leptocephala]
MAGFDAVQQSFVQFTHQCFTKAECRARSLNEIALAEVEDQDGSDVRENRAGLSGTGGTSDTTIALQAPEASSECPIAPQVSAPTTPSDESTILAPPPPITQPTTIAESLQNQRTGGVGWDGLPLDEPIDPLDLHMFRLQNDPFFAPREDGTFDGMFSFFEGPPKAKKLVSTLRDELALLPEAERTLTRDLLLEMNTEDLELENEAAKTRLFMRRLNSGTDSDAALKAMEMDDDRDADEHEGKGAGGPSQRTRASTTPSAATAA